jgi:hypothetical protein
VASHDQPAVLQFLQGFPDWNGTYAEALDQFPFDQALAGAEMSGDDFALHDVDNLFP